MQILDDFPYSRRATLVLWTLVLCACAGAGSSYGPSAPPVEKIKGVGTAFTILVPRTHRHSSLRKPHYASASIQSISIGVNGKTPMIANLTDSSPGCVTVAAGVSCTVSNTVPPGRDTFAVSAFDRLNAKGNELSTATVTQTIVAGRNNTVSMTLDGIVARIVLALQAPPPPEGKSASIGISVMGQDADGNTIVGPGVYYNAITLADKDSSGMTKLSKKTVLSPSTSVVLSYSGGELSSAGHNARITASSPGVNNTNITNAYFVTSQDQWVTWGKSPYRNSYNPAETKLTTSNVSGLKLLWKTQLGGVITDEPIVVANVSGTSEGPVNVLYIGDAHANFYAMNAGTGKVLWKKVLQSETINGNSTDPAQNGCFDQPGGVYGVGASPVADPAGHTVYTVDGMGFLYGFRLATGVQAFRAGPMWAYDAGDNNENITNSYGALTEDVDHGVVYVPSAAHCGNENYGGVQQYAIASRAIAHWYTMGGPPKRFGGVWGPGGAVIDPREATDSSYDDLYVGTAYGPTPPSANQYPYSIVRLNENLTVNSASVNPIGATWAQDFDFGDTPLVFAPSTASGCGTPMLVAAESKNGVLYLFNADNLAAGPTQTIQLGAVEQDGINLGTVAYDPTRNLIYINNGSDSSSLPIKHGLIAFTVTSTCQLSLAWQVTVGPDDIRDGPPSPPTIANGVVYYADGPGSGCTTVSNPKCGSEPADFNAYNASSGALLFHASVPGGLFTAPVVVNGRVYITSWNGQGPGIVYCFGL